MSKSIILILSLLFLSSCAGLLTREDIKKCSEKCGDSSKISHLEKKDNNICCECK